MFLKTLPSGGPACGLPACIEQMCHINDYQTKWWVRKHHTEGNKSPALSHQHMLNRRNAADVSSIVSLPQVIRILSKK